MITTKEFLAAATFGLASLVTTTAIAQTTSSDAGLIGKRHAGADLFMQNYRDSLDNGYGTRLLVNQPVSESVDITGSFMFTSADGDALDYKQQAFEVGAVWYSETENYKPFLSASLGYAFDKFDFDGPLSDDRDEGGIYGIGFGVEVPLTDQTAATGELSYRDGFDSDTENAFGLELGLNHWVNEQVALKGSIYIVEDDSVTIRIGARFAF